MFIIGVTGGIGSGKSTVAQIIGSWGIPVLDADQISHHVTAKGGRALPRIVDQFGTDVLAADGALDREAMSRRVFQDRKELDQLSFIVHEEVMAEMNAARAALERAGEKAVILDVPIPVQKGFIDTCHEIIVVRCDEAVRLQRLVDRGMSVHDAKRRMAMQMTQDEYAALGTCTLDNSGSIDELKEALHQTIGEALHARGIRIKKEDDV